MKFGKILKLIRVLKEVKQKDLAEQLGVSPNYLSLIEGDNREPSLSFVRNVSKVLDVPLSFLFLESIDENTMSGEQRVIFQNIRNLLTEYQALKTDGSAVTS